MFGKVTPRSTSNRQLKKTSNGRSVQFNRYLSYRSHSNFKPTWIFWRFCLCPSNYTFDKNKKISMLVLELHSKDRTSTKDKANIGNPKVNRGCPPTASQQTMCKFHLDPQYNTFYWGSTVLGVSTLWWKSFLHFCDYVADRQTNKWTEVKTLYVYIICIYIWVYDNYVFWWADTHIIC